MTDLEQQEQGTIPAPAAEHGPHGMSAKGAARRRFARVGAGVSGVIMTLSSQPGMAATVCTTPSGFLSGTANSHAPGSTSLGLSPGYWKNNHERWSLARTDGTAQFGTVFYCPGSPLATCTLFEVNDHAGTAKTNDPNNVAMHIVATLLNVRAGQITVLNEEKVLQIWREYATSNGFVPMAGAQPWDGAQIVRYLTSTMT